MGIRVRSDAVELPCNIALVYPSRALRKVVSVGIEKRE